MWQLGGMILLALSAAACSQPAATPEKTPA